ncbi:MAG: hypothetical protein R3F59_28685 [Myxococcota bacterium]
MGRIAIWTEPLGFSTSPSTTRPCSGRPRRRHRRLRRALLRDLDGDGNDDLLVGAPGVVGGDRRPNKPGAVHVWYGPLDPGTEISVSADLYVLGSYTGQRTWAGSALALADGDGDGEADLCRRRTSAAAPSRRCRAG